MVILKIKDGRGTHLENLKKIAISVLWINQFRENMA